MTTTNFGGFPLTINNNEVKGFADVSITFSQNLGNISSEGRIIKTWQISGEFLEKEDGQKIFRHTLKDLNIGYGTVVTTHSDVQLIWDFIFVEKGGINWTLKGTTSEGCIISGSGSADQQIPTVVSYEVNCPDGGTSWSYTNPPFIPPAQSNTEYFDIDWIDQNEEVFELNEPGMFESRSVIRLEFNKD